MAMAATTVAEVVEWTSPPTISCSKHKKAKDAAHNGGRYPRQECAASTRGHCGHGSSKEIIVSTNRHGGTDRRTEIDHDGCWSKWSSTGAGDSKKGMPGDKTAEQSEPTCNGHREKKTYIP